MNIFTSRNIRAALAALILFMTLPAALRAQEPTDPFGAPEQSRPERKATRKGPENRKESATAARTRPADRPDGEAFSGSARRPAVEQPRMNAATGDPTGSSDRFRASAREHGTRPGGREPMLVSGSGVDELMGSTPRTQGSAGRSGSRAGDGSSPMGWTGSGTRQLMGTEAPPAEAPEAQRPSRRSGSRTGGDSGTSGSSGEGVRQLMGTEAPPATSPTEQMPPRDSRLEGRDWRHDGNRSGDGYRRDHDGRRRDGGRSGDDYRRDYGDGRRDGGRSGDDGRRDAYRYEDHRPPQHYVPSGRHHSVRHAVHYLPHHHAVIVHGRGTYHYYSGRFYQPWNGGFLLVRPPLGLIVLSIPLGSRLVVSSGITYHVFGDIYYRRVPMGYEVVEPVRSFSRDWPDRVSVATDLLNLRYGPDEDDEIIAQLDRHTVLRVLGSAPGWLYVEVVGDEEIRGWVMEQYVTTNLGRG